MFTALYSLVGWALTGAVAKLLVGASFSLVIFSGLDYALTSALDSVAYSLSGMGNVALNLALLSGVGTSMSIIGSAMLARALIRTTANIAGLKSS